jgi:hypothetical protein
MKIGLYADNTLSLDVRRFSEVLNGLCATVSFAPGQVPFRLTTEAIRSPSSDATLDPQLVAEASGFDRAFLATNVPYDNNHFFNGIGSNTIVSFSGWHSLTDLPIPNGFAYFIASVLTEQAGLGETHDDNRGCINDFWWDKTGVDLGMRAAFICGDCLRSGPKKSPLVGDIEALLNAISVASRRNEDLLEASLPETRTTPQDFDVFLCHNSDDKPAVRKINEEMKATGIKTWFDEDQLAPGVAWQPELEKAIEAIRSVCVFVGPNGMGPWQDNESRAYLSKFNAENSPVIPVLLPDAGAAPSLPIFLQQRTWVDLRSDYDEGLGRLLMYLQSISAGPMGQEVLL